MYQHAHRGCAMGDAMEVALGVGAEVPEASEHPFEGLVDAILLGLLGILRLGVVEPRRR